MTTEKIAYQKTIIRTLLKVLLMFVLIFMLNSWPNIKQSFNGNIPPLSDWFEYSFKWRNLIAVSVFGIYFYYQDWRAQKEAIENEKKLIEKHNGWIENE